MAQKISSLSEFKVKLERDKIKFAVEFTAAIAKATEKVRHDAEAKFGQYQPAIGPFNAWSALNPDYLKEKLKWGGEDPLIGHYGAGRSNKVYPTPLRNSILSQVQGLRGVVGTNNPIGEWQEFGTSRGIPPRPFLRPALYENRDYIKELFITAIAKTLKG